MSVIQSLFEATQTTGELTDTYSGAAFSVVGALTVSAAVVADVDTPSAKTFDSGVAATKVVQDLTYTAVTRGTAGNSITIAYTGGGTAGAEVVTVVGTAISIQIQSGVSTGTQVKTAYDLSAPANLLATVAVTGTGSNAQTTAALAPFAGGVASEVDTTADTVSIPTHGYTVGEKGQLTSTGTLPAGVTTSTDYFIIVVDANTVAFASSLANAEAGTKINLTSQGSDGAVNTFTPTSIAGASVKLQKSNDGTNWSDEGSATNIIADAVIWLEKVNPSGRYMRLTFTITAGRMNCSSAILVKGPN